MHCAVRYSLKIIGILPLLGLLLCNACIMSRPREVIHTPDWILNHPRRYPSDIYLVGVGSAPTSVGLSLALEAAASSARAELVQTIEVHINHSQRMITQTQSLERKNAGQIQIALDMERSDVASFTTTSTEQVVQGIEIKEKHHSPKEEVLYVLAVLEKETAADRIRKQIYEIDHHLEAEVLKAEEYAEQVDLLMSIRHYRRAFRKSLQVESLRRQLSVLSNIASTNTSAQTSDGIASRLVELFQRYRINLVMVDDSTQIIDTMRDVLTKSSFSINTHLDRSAPGVTLWAKINTQWDTYKAEYDENELQVCRVYINIQLIDHLSEVIIGQINMGENSNAASKDKAKKRALRLLNKRILAELPSAIYRVLSVEMDS